MAENSTVASSSVRAWALAIAICLSGLCGTTAFAQQPPPSNVRVTAYTLGVFSTAAGPMDCDILGMTFGTPPGENQAYCYTGTYKLTYDNLPERATHVFDHFKLCASPSVAGDTGWTTAVIPIPPELHEYMDSVQGGDTGGGRLEYRVVKVQTPVRAEYAGSPCQFDVFQYVLGTAFICPSGMLASPGNFCVAGPPGQGAPPEQGAPAGGSMCLPDGASVGHPILPATAEKLRMETDLAASGPAGLTFTRIYRSNWGLDTSRTRALGRAWSHDHAMRLVPAPNFAVPAFISIEASDGATRAFKRDASGQGWSAVTGADRLTASVGGWLYTRADDDATFSFDLHGKLMSRTERNGWVTRYAYDAAGRLIQITNPFGRSLTLSYEAGGLLASVTTQDGRSVRYAYDSTGRLSTVAYPDGKTRSFVYENAAFPYALTGILDETGARWGSFAYDSAGRAVASELAGGTDRYQVSYPDTSSATIVDPLGTTRSFSYAKQAGKLAVTRGNLPSANGAADAQQRVQDANGLVTSETDFFGVPTTTTWDVARRLPVSVTRAMGRPEAQTVTTQWHPTFALPTLITESGRTTAYTYDSLGNALSETVTDTKTGSTRTRKWTYNAQGLADTQTDGNGATSQLSYDASGNLTQIKNGIGKVTTYGYDGANRLTRIVDANNLITTLSYDARDRLLSQTVGFRPPTNYSYNATGTLATLTLPSARVISFQYDAAQRLIGWSDNQGNAGS